MGMLSHHFMSLYLGHAHYSLYLIQGAKLLLFPANHQIFPGVF